MTTKTTNKFSPEVSARAVRLIFDHEAEHPSRRAAISSIAAKIGCSAHTLHEWVKKAENDTGRRLLEPIGNIPPAEAEANYYAATPAIDKLPRLRRSWAC